MQLAPGPHQCGFMWVVCQFLPKYLALTSTLGTTSWSSLDLGFLSLVNVYQSCLVFYRNCHICVFVILNRGLVSYLSLGFIKIMLLGLLFSPFYWGPWSTSKQVFKGKKSLSLAYVIVLSWLWIFKKVLIFSNGFKRYVWFAINCSLSDVLDIYYV